MAVDAGMVTYYRERAAIYERVYHKPERQAELRALEAWVPGPFAGRHVLEVACGTGWWTPHGARDCAHWLATDINPETMAIAQTKPLPEGKVSFEAVDADTFAELGERRFDATFAGCWWSHIGRERLAGWLVQLHTRLQPGAVVVFLDNAYVEGSSTPIHRTDAQGNTYQWRVLDDGSRHEVIKNFPTHDEALAALGPRARHVQFTPHTHYWVLQYTLA